MMTFIAKNQHKVCLQRFSMEQRRELLTYLESLGSETRSRFAPHRFSGPGIDEVFASGSGVTGYIAMDDTNGGVVAYSLLREGFIDADRERFYGYGFRFQDLDICTYAPSVADQWQGTGIGSRMFHYILDDLKRSACKHVVLWGGVQAGNARAIGFYMKHGFSVVGKFEHEGENLDMMLSI